MTSHRVTLKHLRAFRAVAQYGHFTRAAESIGLSQPALSALIAQLEDDLGTRLLARTTRAVEITAPGKDFLGATSRILTELDNAVSAARDYAALRRGRLRIAALPSLCNELLPALLRRFHDQHAGVTIALYDVPSDAVVDQVEGGQVEIGLAYGRAGTRIQAEPILTDRLVAVARRDQFDQVPTELPWRALDGRDVILMSHGTTIRRLMEDAVRQAQVELRVVLEPNQLPAALAYARAGLGVAVLSSLAIPETIDDELFVAPLVAPVAERTISILTAPDRVLSPAAETMLAMLRKAAGKLQP